MAILCPCGSQNDYLECCGLYIELKKTPPTAEALMRSRYTAFVFKNISYIAKTMAGPAAEDFNQEETEAWLNQTNWLELTVHQVKNGKRGDTRGHVSFSAKYEIDGKSLTLSEKSKFIRDKKRRWLYYEGKHFEEQTSKES